MNWQQVILLGSTTATAMVAGLLYAYSCSVNPGLAKLDDATYIAAMQSINRAIQNPLFFAAFMGALLLLPVSAWMHYHSEPPAVFKLITAAAIVYVIGVFGTTMFFNVPLNNALEQFRLPGASAEQVSAQRAAFEIPWNRWHVVRTVCAFISLVLIVAACIKK